MLLGLRIGGLLLLWLSAPSHARQVNHLDESPQVDFTLRDRTLSTKTMIGNTIIPSQIDGHVDYANSCLIVGYYVNNRFLGNAYTRNMYNQYLWKQQQAREQRGNINNAPPVQRVGNVEELVRAIENCPAGSPLVLASHGFAKWGGGFWLSEDKTVRDPHTAGIVIMQGNQGFTKFVNALAKRRMTNIILHSCEVGQEAAQGRLNDSHDPAVVASFGNKLANEVYRTIHAQLRTDQEKLALRKGQVEVYTEEVYGGTASITAKKPGTRRLIFNTDDEMVAALNKDIPQPDPPPVFAEAPVNPNPSSSTPIQSMPVQSTRPQVSTPALADTSTPQTSYQPPVQSIAHRPTTFGDTAPSSHQVTHASPVLASSGGFGSRLQNPFLNQNFPELAGQPGLPGQQGANAGIAGASRSPNLPGGGSSSAGGGGGGTKLSVDPIPPIKVPTFGTDAIANVLKASVIDESSSYRWVVEALNQISGRKSK